MIRSISSSEASWSGYENERFRRHTHHRALHTVGDEEKWWKESCINPISHAEQLWRERWGETIQQPSRARELINPGLR